MKISEVILKKEFVVTKINKKTKAKMFKNLKVGDVVEFECDLKPDGSNNGISYVHYIGITNLSNGEQTGISPNKSIYYDDIIEFEDNKRQTEFKEDEKVWFIDMDNNGIYAEYGVTKAKRQTDNRWLLESYFGIFPINESDIYKTKEECEKAIKENKWNS